MYFFDNLQIFNKFPETTETTHVFDLHSLPLAFLSELHQSCTYLCTTPSSASLYFQTTDPVYAQCDIKLQIANDSWTQFGVSWHYRSGPFQSIRFGCRDRKQTTWYSPKIGHHILLSLGRLWRPSQSAAVAATLLLALHLTDVPPGTRRGAAAAAASANQSTIQQNNKWHTPSKQFYGHYDRIALVYLWPSGDKRLTRNWTGWCLDFLRLPDFHHMHCLQRDTLSVT